LKSDPLLNSATEDVGVVGYRERLWYWAAALYQMATLVGGSWSHPPGASHGRDKLLHAVVFGGMVLISYPSARRLWRRHAQASGRSTLLVAWGYAVLSGAALEVWQAFLPYRNAEFMDLVADAVGASVAVLVLVIGNRVRLLLQDPGREASKP
jgi:VanZ family protein